MNPHYIVIAIVSSTVAIVFITYYFAEKRMTQSTSATLIHCKIVVPMNPTNEIHYPKNKVKFLSSNNKILVFKVDLKTYYELEQQKNKSATLIYKGSRFIKFENENFSIIATSNLF